MYVYVINELKKKKEKKNQVALQWMSITYCKQQYHGDDMTKHEGENVSTHTKKIIEYIRN